MKTNLIAQTPEPPYYAVIFTSHRTEGDHGYAQMASEMEELVAGQEGFLGLEFARDEVGITVSYWSDLEAIRKWSLNFNHQLAKQNGKEKWYSSFKTRIAKVEKDYGSF